MMGFAKSDCETTVYFQKAQYSPGEKVKFTLECDNSQCKIGVKNFKVKLQRKWIGVVGDIISKKSEYLKVVKFEGTPAKTWLKKEFTFVLPEQNTPLNDVSPISNCLTQSFEGDLLSIQYFLRVFVKHDTWSKGGEGDSISLPISISQPYFTITTNDVSPHKSGQILTAKLTQLDLPD